MIKFVKSKYASINWSSIGLKGVRKDEIFAVTPEIEESQVYQEGIATRNLIPVTIGNTYELSKVVNITDAIKAEFLASIKPKEVVVQEPIPVVEKVTLIVQDAELPDDDDESVDEVDEPEPTISFTELAGNVAKAVEAISTETDIQKLNDALLLDERKTVKKAIQKRIEELES